MALSNILKVFNPLHLLWPIYLVMIIALGIMINQGYRMKGAYDYGKGLEEQCGDEFLERERADYQAFIEYTQHGVEKQFETAYMMFMYSIIAVILIYILWMMLVFVADRTTNKGPDWGLWSGTNIQRDRLQLLKQVTPSYIMPIIFLIAIIIMFAITISYMNKVDGINPFKVTEITIKKTTTPIQKETQDQIDKIVKNQYTLLVLILVFIGLAMIFYHPIIEGQEFITKAQQLNILIIISVGIFFVPMITRVIVKFQNIIGNYYGSNTDILNNQLKLLVTNDRNTEIIDEMQKNIVKAHPEIIKNGDPLPTLDSVEESPYKKTLYSYTKHTLNYADIIAIQIPPDLRNYVLPVYLRGENAIAFKKALSKLYQMRDGVAFNTVSVKGDTRNNTDTQFSTVSGIQGDYAFLKKFFTPDIQELLVTVPTDADKKKKKAGFVDILNRTIITSPLFAKVNPLPVELKDKLAQLRAYKNIKKEVNSYYSTVNWITYLLVFGYAYAIYHTNYLSNPEATTQRVSFMMAVLLAIIGFLGWFTKELWL